MPSRQDPPLGLTDVVQRRAEQNIWHQLDFRSCWQVIMFTMNRLRGSSPDFCNSLAFPPPRYSTRQRSHTPMAITPGHFEGVTSDLRLVLEELPAMVAELHLPEFRNEKFPASRQIYNQG